ncbi:unnamed protein product [Adineta ricciae]|nr:unnamed protein product [Adineta ricciae]
MATLLHFIVTRKNYKDYINSLYTRIHRPEAFEAQIQTFLQEAQSASTDPRQNEMVEYIFKNHLHSPHDPEFQLKFPDYGSYCYIAFDVVELIEIESANAPWLYRAVWERAKQQAITTVVVYCQKALAAYSKYGKMLGNVQIIVTLTYSAFSNIKGWWNGEISGARCVKSIMDDVVAIAGGVAGGVGGAAIGTLIFPGVGTAIGGFLGGVLGGAVAGGLSSWLTEHIFDLAPTVALEKAYRYLGVSHHCSNDEINKAYRRLALQCHPDKGGNSEDFVKLNTQVAIIKAARGDN